MKKYPNTLLTLTALIGASASVSNAATILLEDFENPNDISYSVSDGTFHDSADDHFGIVPFIGAANPSTGTYAGFNGVNYFAAEDIDDNGGPGTDSQTLTFMVNIAGYENISFSTLFAAGGNDTLPAYDTNEEFTVTATIDGGETQNLLAFEAEGPLNTLLSQDTDFDGVGDGPPIDHNFLSYSSPIVGTGSTLTLVVTIEGDDSGSEFAFDDILLEGDFVIPEPSSALLAFLGSAFLLGRRRK